ncbi:MAG: VanZ family protein [Pirellulaceae bacterium]|jgi:VanZ family protein
MGAVFLVYWLVLFTLTHLPKVGLPKLGKYSDKYMHFAAYGVLAFLLAALCSIKWRIGFSLLLRVFLMVALYGFLDELLQVPIPGRMGDIQDWAADLLGALVGVLFFAMAYPIVRAMLSNRASKKVDQRLV